MKKFRDKKADAMFLVEAGKEYYNGGDERKAEEAFLKAVECSQNQSNAYFELGKLMFIGGRYAEASVRLTEAVKNNPKDIHAGLLLAKTFYRLKKYDQAAAEYLQTLKKGYDGVDAQKELAEIYYLLNDFDGAFRIIIKVWEKCPDDKDALLLLARIYFKEEDYDLAIKRYEEAVRSGANAHTVHQELGRVYHKKGDYPRAIRELGKATKSNPNDPGIRAELGRVHARAGSLDLAIKGYNEALKLGLEDRYVRADLGAAYFGKREYCRAIEELEKSAALNPGNGDIMAWLGRAYEAAGEYDLAAKRFEEAVRSGADTYSVHQELGRAYYKKGDHAGAIKEISRSLELNTADGAAHQKLGELYREAGEYELSIRELKKSERKNPKKNDPFLANKILNEIEISERKTKLDSKPRGLVVALTNKCNLKCKMCSAFRKPWDLPKKTLREIEGYFPYLEEIYYEGGEVFLFNRFEELFEKAASYPHLKQYIATNGLLVDKKWARKLTSGNVHVSFSIDGITRKTYEGIRRGAEFETLLKKIELVNNSRKKSRSAAEVLVGMNFVVMKSNYRELDRVLDFARKYNIDTVRLAPIQEGCDFSDENIYFHKDLEAAEYIEKVRPDIAARAKSYNINLFNCLPGIDAFSVNKDFRVAEIENGGSKTEIRDNSVFGAGDKPGSLSNRPGKGHPVFCYMPWQFMFIYLQGLVRPYVYCADVGTVPQDSLDGIWNNRKMQYYRRKIIDNNYRGVCSPLCVSGAISKREIKRYLSI